MIKLFAKIEDVNNITPDIASIDRERILLDASIVLNRPAFSLTYDVASNSTGTKNDYFSQADYWWPDPNTPDGIPYIRYDGKSNPDVFIKHRMTLRGLRDSVAVLAAAYKITKDKKYTDKALKLLKVFFINKETRMNPHMKYSQAILGKSKGRSIGIIDGLHLIEIPVAIAAMANSSAFNDKIIEKLKKWFSLYLKWLMESDMGKQEANTKNNHSAAYWLQVAVFSLFTDNKKYLKECKKQFKTVLLPKQMALDGSFPRELERTKPYAYSIFQLDNLMTLARVLTTAEDNLWKYCPIAGINLSKGIDFLKPYIKDKSKWPYKTDIQHFDDWPIRQPALLFGGIAYGKIQCLILWLNLPPISNNDEVRRNTAITQQLLWI